MSLLEAKDVRKPRLAIMGEFSAGKSTLCNLLLGSRPLPEKVTATQLSPVWITKGSDTPYRVDLNGEETPVSLDSLEDIPLDETRFIRMFFEADILDVCDLIDFPGISDPNMDAEVWRRVLDEVDAVIWCTHATQAWRQSEAAVWEEVPAEVREKSILLITRADKLTTERDRARVLARLQKETAGLFGGIYPVSLTRALAAGEDFEKWQASGAGPFTDHLVAVLQSQFEANAEKGLTEEDEPQQPANVISMAPAQPSFVNSASSEDGPRIVPRRIRPKLVATSRIDRDEYDQQNQAEA